MDQALSDVTVLDLGQVIAMPFCTMLLADLGARVIKVESPERGRERVSLGVKRRRDGVEERVPAAQYRDRNKLGVTLDLKTPAGVELFRELVKRADVVSENFSVGTMERLGLGYEDLRRANPGIVYASITAFGQTGPYAPQRGYDMLAQAISGYMSITGYPDGPPTRSGQSISDYYAGMLCAFSIVSALHYRQRTGRGQRIDLALLDSLVVALDNLGERYTVGGEILTRAGNVSFAGSATGIYPAADGHVAVAASASNAVWARFCAVIGRDELTRDPGFATAAARRDRRDEIAAIIQAWTGPRAKADVVRVLAMAGVPAAPVNNVAEMVADPQVRAREMFVELDHPIYGPLTTTGTPLKLSETPGQLRWLAPMPGEHNEEVFVGLLGHSRDDLARWRAEGVI
ncbi:MAG TPA: CaiB/BaiF CoA-transferase family protein [Methylomirabilota bacterium]|nr:CaiB/BaiF CoA-transferase family protein [Methylomirabilota bacterium]